MVRYSYHYGDIWLVLTSKTAFWSSPKYKNTSTTTLTLQSQPLYSLDDLWPPTNKTFTMEKSLTCVYAHTQRIAQLHWAYYVTHKQSCHMSPRCVTCVCGAKAAWEAGKVQVHVSGFMNQLLSVGKRGSPVTGCGATFIHTNSLCSEDDTHFIQSVWMCVWVCVDMNTLRPTAVRITFSILCVCVLRACCVCAFCSPVYTSSWKTTLERWVCESLPLDFSHALRPQTVLCV